MPPRSSGRPPREGERPRHRCRGGRDADGGELARPVEACQVAGIQAIGLYSPARAARGEGRSDDVVGNAEGAQEPVGLVASGTGLVASDQSCSPTADEFAKHLRRVRDDALVRTFWSGRRIATAIVSLCTSRPRCVTWSMAGPPPCVAPRAAHPRVIHESSRSDRPSHCGYPGPSVLSDSSRATSSRPGQASGWPSASHTPEPGSAVPIWAAAWPC
jgi:hypothetical protein